MASTQPRRCLIESLLEALNSPPTTTIFDGLPNRIRMRIGEEPRGHKDWKVCGHCGVHASSKKLLACRQCQPYIITPTYYCSRECQAAEWKRHKKECEALAKISPPDRFRAHPDFNMLKAIQHWHYVNRGSVRRAATQAFFCYLNADPRVIKVHIYLMVQRDPLEDLPLAWPAKVELRPDVDRLRRPPEGYPGDVIWYSLKYPGGSTMDFCFPLATNWRQENRRMCRALRGETPSPDDPPPPLGAFMDWDLIFINLCLARPNTIKASTLQATLLEIAVDTARKVNPDAYVDFDVERKATRESGDRGKTLVNQSTRWLEILKEVHIWDTLDASGLLWGLVREYETDISTHLSYFRNAVSFREIM